MLMGLCIWPARVRVCVWETVAQLKSLSLMGMTLPSAVHPSCVGKCVFVYFCVAAVNILPVTPFSLLSYKFFSSFAFFVSSVADIPAPSPLSLCLVWLTLGDPRQKAPLQCIQNQETKDSIPLLFWTLTNLFICYMNKGISCLQ